VVNEAIAWERGNGWGLRETKWSAFEDDKYQNYIHAAFDYASKADPNALLFYNDFSLEKEDGKVEATIEMIRSIQDAGIKIDGVGIQYHVDLNSMWKDAKGS